MSSNLSRAAHEADDSDTLDLAIRVGLVAYGVIHLLIGWLALQIAFGEKSNASGTGALEYLARQPMGGVLIWVVTLGMLALVVWRALEVWQVTRSEEGADLVKGVVSQAFRGVLYAVLGWSALQVALNSSGGGGGSDSLATTVMRMPAGQLLLGAVGLGVVAYGGYYVYQGWTDRFLKKLDGRPRNPDVSRGYRLVGKAGHLGKGVAVGVIGVLITYAAITHDPQKSAGLDQALQEIVQQPYGPVLLGLVAVGIACYGVFAFARARHLDR